MDAIEADGVHHWMQRKEMVTRRRRDDDADDVALFLGVPAGEETVDDLGRTRGGALAPHDSIRRSRRQAREARRAARLQSRKKDAESEGWSTDSTLPSTDAEDYALAHRGLLDRAAALSSDVKAEEFLYPAMGIGKRFAEWREREPEEYGAAFGGLGCVQGWEYWARKEMVGWEPSRVCSVSC